MKSGEFKSLREQVSSITTVRAGPIVSTTCEYWKRSLAGMPDTHTTSMPPRSSDFHAVRLSLARWLCMGHGIASYALWSFLPYRVPRLTACECD